MKARDPEAASRGDAEDSGIGGFKTALLAVSLVILGSMIIAVALGLAAAAIAVASGAAPGLWNPAWGSAKTFVAALVFVATYIIIAIGKLPFYQLDRAGAALLGASLMVGLGVVSLEDAYRSIDFDAITLLLGMMIVVANLRLSGFFRIVSNWAVTRAGHPLPLLFAIVLVSGFSRPFSSMTRSASS